MRSFGVEEELLLVQAESGHPLAVASLLLDSPGGVEAVPSASTELTAEMQQEQLEAVTTPQETVDGLRAAITAGRTAADRAARKVGGRAVALATSPLSTPPHVMPHTRYVDMVRRYGMVARDTLTMGCHIHVSIDDPEEGVGVLDRIRVWLPVLTALSANSPFRAGEDTGHASWRTVVFRQWPTSGPLDLLGSAAAYRRLVDESTRTGVLIDEGMIYTDARLSRNHPTVEVRVADLCLLQTDAALIAALTRGLVETAAREWRDGAAAPDVRGTTIRLASWRAALDGLRGDLVDPLAGTPRPAAEVVSQLLEHVRPALRDAGDEAAVESGLRRLLEDGTGADWQRAAFERTGRLEDVITEAVDVTHRVGAPLGTEDPGR